MLVLGRRVGEWLILDLGDGREVAISVNEIRESETGCRYLKIAIDAPQTVRVYREELLHRRPPA